MSVRRLVINFSLVFPGRVTIYERLLMISRCTHRQGGGSDPDEKKIRSSPFSGPVRRSYRLRYHRKRICVQNRRPRPNTFFSSAPSGPLPSKFRRTKMINNISITNNIFDQPDTICLKTSGITWGVTLLTPYAESERPDKFWSLEEKRVIKCLFFSREPNLSL